MSNTIYYNRCALLGQVYYTIHKSKEPLKRRSRWLYLIFSSVCEEEMKTIYMGLSLVVV